MRPLEEAFYDINNSRMQLSREELKKIDYYENNLLVLSQKYHNQCMFNKKSMDIPLKVWFDSQGVLYAKSKCKPHKHQGYNGIVHGGITASIIDASMCKCLMGHGFAGYTASLNIRYSNALLIDKLIDIVTVLEENKKDKLFKLSTKIYQDNQLKVKASSSFMRM